MIGTTRSRVSFFMNKFRKLGFIDYNGGIEVHSSLLNVVLHDSRKSRLRFHISFEAHFIELRSSGPWLPPEGLNVSILIQTPFADGR